MTDHSAESEHCRRRLGLVMWCAWIGTGIPLIPLSFAEDQQAAEREPPVYGPVEFAVPLPPDISALEREVLDAVRKAAKKAETDPDDDKAIARLGMLYHANLLAELAVPCYRRATELNPWNPQWHHLLAVAARDTGDPATARSALSAVRELRPDYPPALFSLGEILLDEGRIERASELFERVIALEPGAAAGYFGLGRAEAQQGNYARARELLSQARDRAPNNKRVLHQLGMACRRLAQAQKDSELTARAREYLQAARDAETSALLHDPWRDPIRTMTVNAAALAERARKLAESGRFRESGELLEKVIQRRPKEAAYLLQLATVRFKQNNKADAKALCQRAVEVAPGNYRAWATLGEAYLATGEVDPARSAANRALALAPDDVEVLDLSARIHLQAGQVEESVNAFRKVLAGDPQHAGAAVRLADALIRLRRVQEALPWARRAVELDPNSAYARFELGVALAQTGDLAGAERELRTALSLNPSSSSARQYLDWVLEQRSKAQEAETQPASED